ncbi:MAG TPA: hypothetical protein VHO70_20215 [Chitinispirillaceae bacterium]|nr:hypothetical protein [Chitinispirillaceae bacterium]
MKKIVISALLLISLSSFVSALWNYSGWKYITSLTYEYTGGKLIKVTVWGSETPGGIGNAITIINDSDILAKPFLVKIVENLEKAKEDVQNTHIKSTDAYEPGKPAIYEYSKVIIDHEDN